MIAHIFILSLKIMSYLYKKIRKIFLSKYSQKMKKD